MNLSRRTFIALAAMAPARAWASPCCGPVTGPGARLSAFLDGSGVDRLWLAGFKVQWENGVAIQAWASPHAHTHCSAFAASAAMKLGVYLLRPPEHSPVLLANAQMGWLRTPAAAAQGWTELPDMSGAQSRANAGELAVAVYENPDPEKPGHIAILRPSDIDAATLLAQGPFITQAGGHNWISAPMKVGFGSHWRAWHNGRADIRFFAHPIDWSSVTT